MRISSKPTASLGLAAVFGLLAVLRPAPAAFPTETPAAEAEIRLTVFHPRLEKIEDLLALRASGALDIPELSVTGVHHRLEKTDYRRAEKFLRDQGIGWMTLRGVEAEVRPEDLCRPNAWTPEFERIIAESDGVIFFGGPDIPASLYGDPQSLHTLIRDQHRHHLEISAAFHFLGGSRNPDFHPLLEARPDFPVLGICLGMQTMNVAAGGTLVQDIWAETYGVKTVEEAVALGPDKWHTNPLARLYPPESVFPDILHVIRFAPEGRLASLTGMSPLDRPLVISAHHQQMGTLGRGLRVEAVSADGKVVEALSHDRFPNVLGIQFHPEFDILWTRDFPYNLLPGEENILTVRQHLEKNPPSVAFHRNLWAWFGRALRASAAAARSGRSPLR